MKLIIVNLLCATLFSMVQSHHFKKGGVFEVEEAKKFQGFHLGMSKKKAEISGIATGIATGIAKKKEIHSKPTFRPYKPEEPKMTIKWITVVKPVLVRVDPPVTQEKLYIKEEVKKGSKKSSKAKFVPSFLKGFVKGKFIGKMIGKKL